jgi:hypothetical protein
MNENESSEMNDSVMQQLRSYRWKGRVLTGFAFALGLLSMVASILIAWANAARVMPMERLLLEDYPAAVQMSGHTAMGTNVPVNAEGKAVLPREELDWRHVQVTAALGKVAYVTAFSITLACMGTFTVLLLVIFNRRVTLRQINSNLAQISEQIKSLQNRQDSGSA